MELHSLSVNELRKIHFRGNPKKITEFLKPITHQVKCCSFKFGYDFDHEDQSSSKGQFIYIIRYHQNTSSYTPKVFNIFDMLTMVYVGVTSLGLASIAHEIASLKTNQEDELSW
ncbi:uncharacterized protein [Euwallacea fornicatus]|uniref:uncharacterized protein isoform X2 n=1 Tax=Euwallacea fornicatus TaxID=995702 RepID=UPI00338FCE8A